MEEICPAPCRRRRGKMRLMHDQGRFEALHREHAGILQKGVEQALSASGFDALAIHSGTPLKRTEADDQYWSLRPTPHFQHWAPLTEPGCLVVGRPGKKPLL